MKIYQQLVEAQKTISCVANDAENKFQGFTYTSAEAIIHASRSALSAAGIALICKSSKIVGSNLVREIDIAHENEMLSFSLEWPIVEQKGRPADKALAGALTSSLAYFLRDLLLIPRMENEDDISGRDDREHEPQKEQEKPQVKTRPIDSLDAFARAKKIEWRLAHLLGKTLGRFQSRDYTSQAQADQILAQLSLPWTYSSEPPKNGKDLSWYVDEIEAHLVYKGCCDKHHLDTLCKDAAKQEGYPKDPSEWTQEQIREVWTYAKSIAKELQAPKV